MHTDL